jgi:nucleotide-binding universal stress UspA family protein
MSIRAVMVATDFSPASDGAIRMAREIAGQSGACIHLVHVVPPVPAPDLAAELLSGLAGRLGPEDRVRTGLLSGRPAREITRYAREAGIDLIVVGTHGRTGVTRVILGSVAEAVVRLASCPVLTVPAASSETEAPAVTPPAPEPESHCVVCARPDDDLICETCRERIRGAALERKLETERSGRPGIPA